MPTKAEKPAVPPAEMRDRQEGFGYTGVIVGYPEYRDDGVWPVEVVRRAFDFEPPETSDTRGLGWRRDDGSADS
jgi:hypothetical protein